MCTYLQVPANMTKILIIALFLALFWVGVYHTENAQTMLSTPAVSKAEVLGTSLDNTSTSTAILALTNKDREISGLAVLNPQWQLTKAAQDRAEFLCGRPFAHDSDGSTPWDAFKAVGYNYHHAGENLAKDYADPDQIEYAFMHSPEHRDNIVNPNYTQYGVGWACGITVVLFAD